MHGGRKTQLRVGAVIKWPRLLTRMTDCSPAGTFSSLATQMVSFEREKLAAGPKKKREWFQTSVLIPTSKSVCLESSVVTAAGCVCCCCCCCSSVQRWSAEAELTTPLQHALGERSSRRWEELLTLHTVCTVQGCAQ